jgi:hypothetical protein
MVSTVNPKLIYSSAMYKQYKVVILCKTCVINEFPYYNDVEFYGVWQGVNTGQCFTMDQCLLKLKHQIESENAGLDNTRKTNDT